MEKILISACLTGKNTKYDGSNNYNTLIDKLLEKYDLVPFCGEVEGGLKIPRRPCEIKNNKVINDENKDMTYHYNLGAYKALNICKYLNIKIAILKENSPMCGVNHIYDGTFSHTKINGQGILTSLLIKNDIKVYNEDQIEQLLK